MLNTGFIIKTLKEVNETVKKNFFPQISAFQGAQMNF